MAYWSSREIEQGLCDAEDAWIKEQDSRPQPEACDRFQGLIANHGGICAHCRAHWNQHPGGLMQAQIAAGELRREYLLDQSDRRANTLVRRDDD